jgi:hypothetical protein
MAVASFDGMRCSVEHKEVGTFAVDQVPDLNMPEGYKKSIAAYAELFDGGV